YIPKTAEGRRRGRLERGIRFAATLADTLLADGYRVHFRAFAPDPIAVDLDPRARDLELLLTELAVLRPTRNRPFSHLVMMQQLPRNQALFLLRICDDPLPRRADLTAVASLPT